MKLKYKLIPLASIGAVCATVTPLITSCGTSGWMDLNDKFIPTIAQYSKEGVVMNLAEANEAYLDALLENKEIFREDYLWHTSNLISSVSHSGKEELKEFEKFYEEDVVRAINEVALVDEIAAKELKSEVAEFSKETRKVKFKFDKVKINVTKITTGSNTTPSSVEIGSKVPLISYDIEYKYEMTRSIDNDRFEGTTTEKMLGKCRYENIPFVATWNYNNNLFEFIASCPTASSPSLDIKNLEYDSPSLMTSQPFYGANPDNPWKVSVEYERTVREKGNLAVLGDVDVTTKSSNSYSVSADEYFERSSQVQWERVRKNFSQACSALDEDGWIYSYYMYPVGYNGRRVPA
ncbi:MAG: hypothetical protein KBS35_03045 [Mycoplasma sp.]|nr:hypothetical protein [Candidatus Hennigella equi]